MHVTLAALVLAGAFAQAAAAEVPSAESVLAAELRALPDDAAREAWLAAHRAQVTPALGRALGVLAQDSQKAGRYDEAMVTFALAVRVGENASDLPSRIAGLPGRKVGIDAEADKRLAP